MIWTSMGMGAATWTLTDRDAIGASLGEIVDFATLLRLQMEIKDVDGRKIPLYFYTDGRDSELAPAQVQRGYTVAILYV